ncbi:MAG TPA: FmdB family zinc ribbon protein [Thermoanaerobaculia bacterium]|nr:FmdB family zinc ribbon protein [Thermoanaerobaculia bacterium]
MPLYEYQCRECSETHEFIQKFSDPPYTICPSCGGELRKLASAPAIQFKGSGFYITDYGKGDGGKKGESSGKTDGGKNESGSKSEGSESKSASAGTGSASEAPAKSSSKGSRSESPTKP